MDRKTDRKTDRSANPNMDHNTDLDMSDAEPTDESLSTPRSGRRRARGAKAADESGPALRDAKRALRREIAASIAAIPALRRAWRDRRIADLVVRAPALAGTPLVLAYRAMPDEVDLRDACARLAVRGARVAFPSVDAHGRLSILLPARLDDASLWTTDRFGIAAPRAGATGVRVVAIREVDAVLVPGRAFTRLGARLGRGKGYYDALLRALRADARRATLGVCYREQVVADLPEAPHDARVAGIASDAGLVACRLATRPRAPISDDSPEENG